MKNYFSPKMCVAPLGWSTPSHDKPCRFVQAIEQYHLPVTMQECKPVEPSDWYRLHSQRYVDDILKHPRADLFEQASLQLSDELLTSVAYAGGSMVDATLDCLESGCSLSPSSGWHHAHYDQPGVFCLLNGLMLAAVTAQIQGGVEQVLILDCDYHFGNGTEDILARLEVSGITNLTFGKWFTRPSHARDYLNRIREVADEIRTRRYDLVIYQSGMDVLLGDPSGGGIMTFVQLRERDCIVFEATQDSKTPIVWNFGGGYSEPGVNGEDRVIRGHLNTLLIALQIYENSIEYGQLLYNGDFS